MRNITYAGETVITTDDVASELVALAATLARAGLAEAVSIPIVDGAGGSAEAELVVGFGNDVLSVPIEWRGDEPDFSLWAKRLSRRAASERATAAATESHGDDRDYDFDHDRG